MTDQKTIFLDGEGDAYFERNRDCPDITLSEFNTPLLEIGCGEGLNGPTHGIDPSPKAVAAARKRRVDAVVGTADNLPWPDGMFITVVFGFCLYLCDREDLYKIAAEADRVLVPGGTLVIHDFHEGETQDYEHCDGIKSYHANYRLMFWTYELVRTTLLDETKITVLRKPTCQQ